jgi:hypothetical protein
MKSFLSLCLCELALTSCGDPCLYPALDISRDRPAFTGKIISVETYLEPQNTSTYTIWLQDYFGNGHEIDIVLPTGFANVGWIVELDEPRRSIRFFDPKDPWREVPLEKVGTESQSP